MIVVRVEQDSVFADFAEDAGLFEKLIGDTVRAGPRPLLFQHRDETTSLLATL